MHSHNQTKQVLLGHVVKGVLPADKLKAGTVLNTLAPKATLKVYVPKSGGLELIHPEVHLDDDEEEAHETDHGHADEHADDVVATNLTFEGPYKPGSKYVVHAVDHVMVPQAAGPALQKLAAKAASGRKMLL